MSLWVIILIFLFKPRSHVDNIATCLTGHISSQSSLVQSIGNTQLALTLMMTSSQAVKMSVTFKNSATQDCTHLDCHISYYKLNIIVMKYFYCFPGSVWRVKWLGRTWRFPRPNDTHNNETMVWPGERNCQDTHWGSNSLRFIWQWRCRNISYGYLDNWTMDSFQPNITAKCK